MKDDWMRLVGLVVELAVEVVVDVWMVDNGTQRLLKAGICTPGAVTELKRPY